MTRLALRKSTQQGSAGEIADECCVGNNGVTPQVWMEGFNENLFNEGQFAGGCHGRGAISFFVIGVACSAHVACSIYLTRQIRI